MPTNFEMVREFHETFGQPVPKKLTFLDDDREVLRNGFIEEEYQELREAQGYVFYEDGSCSETKFNPPDIVGIADALVDLQYFIYGQALEYGIDADACFAEVHASNMSKLDENGNVLYRADGKVLKSQLFTPPDLARVLGVSE